MNGDPRCRGVTVREAIPEAVGSLDQAGVWTPRLDAEVLLAHVLGQDRTWLFVHPDRMLAEEELARFRDTVRRRCEREPVAYITGRKEFMSLPFYVDRRVMIPRPETEALVEWTVTALRGRPAGRATLVADVGTGSGAIAVSLALALPQATVFATDVSAEALEVARVNVERHGLAGRVTLAAGPLLDPVESAAAKEGRSFDAIVSNPPYIPAGVIADLAREITYEPRLALLGGADGLDLYRALLPGAGRLLAPGGFLAVEVGCGQAEAVRAMACACGWAGRVEAARDLGGVDRVVAMWKDGPHAPE